MSPSTMVAGLLFGLSLIVAIGAQNAFVLAQGAQRRHVGVVVAICASSDVLLVVLAIGGLATVATADARLLAAIHWFGAAVLLAYATLCARRVLRPGAAAVPTAAGVTAERSKVILAACLFTWLNPAVYLDMVVVGSVADSHQAARWSFGAGVAIGSVLWFAALGYGAGLLSPLLARPHAGRYLDAFIAVTMAATATRLLLS